jgi:hypothetical protein
MTDKNYGRDDLMALAADNPLAKNKRIILSKTEWARLRNYVIARDGACLVCGYSGSMAPAHVVGRGAGGDDSPRNVIWLCQIGPGMTEGCHPKLDQYKITLPDHVYRMLEAEPERVPK